MMRKAVGSLYVAIALAIMISAIASIAGPTTGYYPKTAAFPPKTCANDQVITWESPIWTCKTVGGGGSGSISGVITAVNGTLPVVATTSDAGVVTVSEAIATDGGIDITGGGLKVSQIQSIQELRINGVTAMKADGTGLISSGAYKLAGNFVMALASNNPTLAASDGSSLSIVETTGGATVNLTTANSATDWIAFNCGNGNFNNRKIKGNYRLQLPVSVGADQGASGIGIGQCAFGTCAYNIDWTAGDSTLGSGHTASTPCYQQVTNASNPAGDGWVFVADAIPSQQVLRLYLAISLTTGYQCTATLTDGTSPVSTASLNPGSTLVSNIETITFRASVVGTKLIVYCRATGSVSGGTTGVTWFAETLAPT